MSRDFSALGHALSSPARTTFLNMLMDGSSRPAGELARSAGVSPATASEHLAVLTKAGLIQCQVRGRQRFYALTSSTVAAALEHLGQLCPAAPVINYKQSRQARDLAEARFCYDHLAGRLGVALLEALLHHHWISHEEYTVTVHGRARFNELGIDTAGFQGSRPHTRPCPDWTERKNHLAGALGAALGHLFLERRWVARRPTGRGLTVTPKGLTALRETWNLELGTSRK